MYLDTAELKERMGELEDIFSAEGLDAGEYDGGEYDDVRYEYEAIKDLAETLGSEFGNITLISEDSFREHIENTVIECGDFNIDGFLYSYIDWDGLADDMKSDYICVEYEGGTYYYRE